MNRALLLAVLVALGMAIGGPATAAPAPDYVAVIDAGSSGTRLALFAPGAGVRVKQIYRAEVSTPALSSFEVDPTSAGPRAIAPLLDQLQSHLAGRGIASRDVSVAVLATAGMRLLRLNDPVAARKIFASTRASIESSPFTLRANRILPGVREASLAWLDANVLARTLRTPNKDIGIMEVGGASAQVAFRSADPTAPGVATVRVDGRRIGVVAVSVLGLGLNEARAAMQRQNALGVFCFPNNPSGVDPQNYLATSSAPVPSAQADFLGAVCGRAYRSTIRGAVAQTHRRLRPRNLHLMAGFERARFIGLGGISYVYGDFGIPAGANARRGLEDAIGSTCEGSDAWSKVRALYPDPPSTFTEVLCSSAAYLNQFLFGPSGVGLAPKRFQPTPQFARSEPSWSEGYAVKSLHP